MIETKHYDLVICGGGVIGLSIAYQCVKIGWTVCIIDAGEIGKGSSWAGAGILPAGATLDALDPLEQLRSQNFWQTVFLTVKFKNFPDIQVFRWSRPTTSAGWVWMKIQPRTLIMTKSIGRAYSYHH